MRKSSLLLIVGILATAMGCGGAQSSGNSKVDTCKQRLGEFTKDGDVCDPIRIDQLELDIKNSQKYSDELRVINSRRDLCSKRIREMGSLDCLGKRCERILEDAKALVDECNQYKYADDTLDLANRLVPYFEKKIADNKATVDFTALSKECDETGEIIAQGHADVRVLLGHLLEKIKGQDRIEVTREEGTLVELARTTAISSCSEAMRPAALSTLSEAAKEMGKRRTKRKPDIWMAHYNFASKLSDDLQAVRGETVFPESTAAAKKVVEDFKGQKEKLETTAADKIASKSLRSSKKDIKKCKRLIKKESKFRAKVLSHQAKNNEKKVVAYQAKLDKTSAAIDALKATFQQILNREDITEATKKRLKENLLKINCLDAKVVETTE